MTTRDNHRIVMNVHATFFGFIIGKNGAIIKEIQQETNTRIKIPRADTGVAEITIIGQSQDGVSAAKSMIDDVVAAARQIIRFTHFVTLPLNNEPIIGRFLEFKEQVLAECGDCQGVNEEIFQDPAKLHVTIAPGLVLLTEDERQRAQEILEDCLENIVKPLLREKPLVVDVSGLGIMNDDLGRVRVLYGKLSPKDGSNVLQELADKVRQKFSASDLCQERHREESVKIHTTLLNSAFRDEGSEARRRSKEPFDARKIMEKFETFSFGELRIDSLYLAELGRRREDGSFYWQAGIVHLP